MLPLHSTAAFQLPFALHHMRSRAAATNAQPSQPSAAMQDTVKDTHGVLSSWVTRVAAIVCGTLFGFFLHKAGMFRASVIVGQFTFADFRMLKVPWDDLHIANRHFHL